LAYSETKPPVALARRSPGWTAAAADKGLLVTLRGTTGWIEVETWIKFARIAEGPLSRRVRGQGKDVGPGRLNDQEVTRLVEKVPDAVSAGDLFAPCATI